MNFLLLFFINITTQNISCDAFRDKFSQFNLNLLTKRVKICKLYKDGRLAQLGEHLFDVQKVIGSIPIAPTILFRLLESILLFLSLHGAIPKRFKGLVLKTSRGPRGLQEFESLLLRHIECIGLIQRQAFFIWRRKGFSWIFSLQIWTKELIGDKTCLSTITSKNGAKS